MTSTDTRGQSGHGFVLSATTDEHGQKEDRRHDPRDGDQKRDRLDGHDGASSALSRLGADTLESHEQAQDGDCEKYQDDGARDHLLSLTPRVG